MPKKKNKNKRSNLRATNRILTGLRITWSEDATSAQVMEGNITDAQISHANHNYRQTCKHVWLKYGPQVYEQLPLTWRIHITAVFTTDDHAHEDIHEEYETVAQTLLAQLAVEVQPWVDQIPTLEQEISLEAGQPYRLTEFIWRVECLGNRPPRTADFGLTA